MKLTERTRIRNHPERAVPEETTEILSNGIVAHLGFIQDDVPFVIPFTYHYDPNSPDSIYLHGSIRSRALKHLATGAPVCVTVTLTDGLVYSRKAMNHSVNYRSVTLFGHAREVTDEAEKFDLFDQMVQRYFPGRTVGEDYYAPPSPGLGRDRSGRSQDRGVERQGPPGRSHRPRRRRPQRPRLRRRHRPARGVAKAAQPRGRHSGSDSGDDPTPQAPPAS